jgi:hypothetical protein
MEIDKTVGKYKFRITDNTMLYDGQIYARNLKIGGEHTECVHISIKYVANKPVSAYIPILSYDPDCSLEIPLDRGTGSIMMIQTILKYVRDEFPEIDYVQFDDMSSIDCGDTTRPRPVPLYFFSLAFNGLTWYEKYFNARLLTNHSTYRDKVSLVFQSPKPSFVDFLRIANPPLEIIDELKPHYDKTNTYAEFFSSIPKENRCKYARDWISTFMKFHFANEFSNSNWMIPIREKTLGGKTQKRRKSSYYFPKNKILNHNRYMYNDVGAAYDM